MERSGQIWLLRAKVALVAPLEILKSKVRRPILLLSNLKLFGFVVVANIRLLFHDEVAKFDLLGDTTVLTDELVHFIHHQSRYFISQIRIGVKIKRSLLSEVSTAD